MDTFIAFFTPHIALFSIGLALLMLVLDWKQTLVIARNPDKWREINPILGDHPSPLRVHVWFSFCAGCIVLFGVSSPYWIATLGMLVVAACELGFVLHNYKMGLRF